MRVESKDDRPEQPEECDNCGSDVELKRYEYYGPGHNVDWLCSYCANDYTHGDPVIKTIAAMFNNLEKRLNQARSHGVVPPQPPK